MIIHPDIEIDITNQAGMEKILYLNIQALKEYFALLTFEMNVFLNQNFMQIVMFHIYIWN